MALSGFNTILHAIPDSLALVNKEGQILSVNRSWSRFAQKNDANEATEKGVGLNYLTVCRDAFNVGVKEAGLLIETIRDVCEQLREMGEVEYQCDSPTRRRWFIARVTLVSPEPDAIVLISHVDITARKEAELRVQRESQDHLAASLTDPLTGLRNRRGLENAGAVLWESAKRQGDKLAVIYLDLNDFKPVNDNWGHQEGDRVLKHIAEHLQATFRASDLIARVGGDEFVVMARMGNTTDKLFLTRRLRREFEFPVGDKGSYSVSVAMGVAVQGEDQFQSLEELIRCADQRMFEDKKAEKRT
jgi:diguanylate cyclase (GGDEF)-like protein